jgi:hypothetical protein
MAWSPIPFFFLSICCVAVELSALTSEVVEPDIPSFPNAVVDAQGAKERMPDVTHAHGRTSEPLLHAVAQVFVDGFSQQKSRDWQLFG